MTGSTTVLHVVVAIVWAMSVDGSETWKTETNTESLHPSSHVPFENMVTPTATEEAFRSSNTEHSTEKLATSHDTKPLSTLSFSIATPQTNAEITTALTSTPVATTELIHILAETSAAKSVIETTPVVNATQLAHDDTSVLSAGAVLHSLDVTHHHSLETSSWSNLSSETEIESTLARSHSTVFEGTATYLWHQSSAIENQTSATESHITPSQHSGATTTSRIESTSSPKSVTDRPASSTSAKSTTAVSKIALHNSSEDLTPGAKIAIGVTVTLCILGVIVVGVVLYRRFNITHRSLKSFLTSGVRYKTYKNATYKDDEGMLIMPDRR